MTLKEAKKIIEKAGYKVIYEGLLESTGPNTPWLRLFRNWATGMKEKMVKGEISYEDYCDRIRHELGNVESDSAYNKLKQEFCEELEGSK